MTMQKRIAKSLDQAKPHYTVLVIGSGYGAGVAASRLARAGQDVAVLERGKERLPGEYPNKLADAQDAMQINAKGGLLGRKLVVVSKDDESTPAVGVSRANEMIAEKADVVIEGWNSPVTLAMQPILARAGVLDGARATTNKQAFAWAAAQGGAGVRWEGRARWCVDRGGRLWTSGGVAAGIDMTPAELLPPEKLRPRPTSTPISSLTQIRAPRVGALRVSMSPAALAIGTPRRPMKPMPTCPTATRS